MLRTRLSEAAQRAFVMIARGTLVKADDAKKWQEVTLRSEISRKFTNVEVAHHYGFTAVALPPQNDKTSEAAEVVIAYLDGDMSHPIVLAVGDRRYRIKGLQDGEVAIYDDQGQKVHLTRAGIVVDGGSKKLPVTITVGNATGKFQDGKITAKVDKLAVYVRPARIDLGKLDAPHAVMTVDGPSTKVFAVIDEQDG